MFKLRRLVFKYRDVYSTLKLKIFIDMLHTVFLYTISFTLTISLTFNPID